MSPSVRRGAHAADDGSFGRSAGSAAIRGALLIVAAFLLGFALLSATSGTEPFEVEQADDDGRDRAASDDDDDEEEGDDTTTTTVAVRPPAEVGVLVANASGVQGAGGRRTEELAAAGYRTLEATTALARSDTSMVFYQEGFEAEAQAVANLLSPPPSIAPMPPEPPVSDLGDANVLVVISTDLAG